MSQQNEQPPPQVISREEADILIEENREWASAVTRSVARAWNLDNKSDGLESAGLEALIFCARRFKKDLGVPFRGYARKRIHEAASEEARKIKGLKRHAEDGESRVREVSLELLNIFPELRSGGLPFGDTDSATGDSEMRSAIRNLLMGASLVAAKQDMISNSEPDAEVDLKKIVKTLATLDPVHQIIVWKVYWEGLSLRGLADEWKTDELNVMREHKLIIAFLVKATTTSREQERMKIRPALRQVALDIRRAKSRGPFSEMVASG